MKYSEVYSRLRLVSLVLVVVILDKTLSFHSEIASFTTDVKLVPAGISRFTLLQACSVEIHEIPTREITSSSLNVNRAPTRVEFEVDETEPPAFSMLCAAPVAVYVLFLVASASK